MNVCIDTCLVNGIELLGVGHVTVMRSWKGLGLSTAAGRSHRTCPELEIGCSVSRTVMNILLSNVQLLGYIQKPS